LRPEATVFLRGCDLILHAGDICDASVLEGLRAIAPTVAVKCNNDRGAWTDGLRASETVEVSGVGIHIVHDIADLGNDPAASQADVVVTGHSHKPSIQRAEKSSSSALAARGRVDSSCRSQPAS
jgi:putative phosphoesterase